MTPSAKENTLSGYQWLVVGVLAFLQFSIILDFMVMSPLGAMLMPALQITPSQFGLVVSAYAFSAGLSAIAAAGFADRFDRKKLLLFFYAGFICGTLFCALAPTFHALLLARIVTGMFGGVIGSIVLAITTDLFSFQLRGRVMGVVQTAFAASQVLGLPIGLYFANAWGWHAPFVMIVLVSIVVWGIILISIRPIDAHLSLPTESNPFLHLRSTLTNPRYVLAFAATGLLTLGGYLLMPFGSAFTVNNLGIDMQHLPIVYLVTGICAIAVGPLVGRASDSYGKFNVFACGALLTIVMVLIYTNLGTTPLPWVLVVNVLLFTGIFSRVIPAQALVSAIPEPSSRGAFMAVNSSLQQLAGGLASVLAGLIVVQESSGKLVHFDRVGLILVTTVLITVGMMYLIHRRVPEAVRP
ncbi:MAG: MFS transporter [Hyphomicrobiales bacterium]|nr:MAG: MFS transporter [Hyphomicrobiales bacterium]